MAQKARVSSSMVDVRSSLGLPFSWSVIVLPRWRRNVIFGVIASIIILIWRNQNFHEALARAAWLRTFRVILVSLSLCLSSLLSPFHLSLSLSLSLSHFPPTLSLFSLDCRLLILGAFKCHTYCWRCIRYVFVEYFSSFSRCSCFSYFLFTLI